MSFYYTGIGSRACPKEICKRFVFFAVWAENLGFTLRSGGADGADSAFELGVKLKKEIYLPWPGFNGNRSPRHHIPKEAFDLASEYHPNWANLSDPVKKLMSRNVQQCLGQDLTKPSSFLVCWTPNGELKGGTAQALRLAQDYEIPIFNFGKNHIEVGKELRNFVLDLAENLD